jgi:hypothetical protein
MSRKSRMRQRQRVATQATPAPQEEEIEVVEEEIPGDEPEVEIVDDEPAEGAEDEGHEGDEPPADDGEDPYEVLKRNYETALKEKERAERRWEEVETKRQAEAQRRAELEAREYELSSSKLTDQKALLEHALMAAEGEATNAEVVYANAMSEGDYAAAAKAQRVMAAAEAKRMRLQEGRDALEEQIKAVPQRPEPPRHDPADPIEQQISGFTPRTQTWLRAHKADIFGSDDRKEDALYFDSKARRAGLKPDTDEYFAFLDKNMGYAAAEPETPPKPRAPVRPSAPVSRAAPGQSRNVVTLTAEERDTAQRMGMTPAKYAEYKRRIADGEFNVKFG